MLTCRGVDISRLGTQVLFPVFLAYHPSKSKQLSRLKVDRVRRWYPGFGCVFFGSISININKKWISRGDSIDMVSVSVVRKLINMSHVSQEKNVHLWLMPVLQRGSSIIGDIDFISFWFFLQVSPRLVEAAIREQKKHRIWQPFCLGQIQYLDIS